MTIFYPFLICIRVSGRSLPDQCEIGVRFRYLAKKGILSGACGKHFGVGTGKKGECLTVGCLKFLRKCCVRHKILKGFWRIKWKEKVDYGEKTKKSGGKEVLFDPHDGV